MKDVLNGKQNYFYLTGLKYKGGNILTPDGDILGGVDDFVGNRLNEDDDIPIVFVRAGSYRLYNLEDSATNFICQHN